MPDATPSSPRTLVIVPTYNELENLPLILDRIHAAAPEVDVLVVDDSSPDGTGALADERAGANAQVHVMHRTTKNGLGKAYIAGFQWGLERDYDILVEMDADGSHAPENLPRILAATSVGDLVIGSRYVAGGHVVNWPLHRMLLSKAANLYARLALGDGLLDITAGYRAYKAEVLRALPLNSIESHGYCFQVDLAWRTVQEGFIVIEVPITFTERAIGASKMSGSIIREALVKITYWGIKQRLAQATHSVRESRRNPVIRAEEPPPAV
ncbi:MAG: polyprenol monophosphomannose synthase [Nakamurella sp.]